MRILDQEFATGKVTRNSNSLKPPLRVTRRLFVRPNAFDFSRALCTVLHGFA